MARYEFKLPDIGEGIAEAEIVAWHVKVGDQIEEDQQLADMMTDKATVEMESPVAGKVLEVAGEVGDQIAIGSVLVVIETEGQVLAEEVAPAAEPRPDESARHDEVALADGLVEETPALEAAMPSAGEARGDERPAEPEGRESDRRGSDGEAAVARPGGPVLASPAVRARARDLGIDLASVKSAGDRVRHADLDAYLLYNGGSVSHGAAARRQDEEIKVVGLRRKIAENLQEAKRRVPHFTYVDEVDVTALEQTRAMMNADRGGNPKLTMLPFLITAMCRVLPQYPQINARYDDDANIIRRSGAVHMGMATQTDSGLAVPVIRNAENRDVWDLAREILRVAEATRAGKATREELSGSTITISSLGPMGGIVSTPVINRPEVAIIAVNKVEEKPVVVDGQIVIRKRMNLSLSCDHRVVDGWDAASFIQDLKKVLENPLKLLSLR
ncbi:dihydrolipoamide acetyltransferase family protein [Sphingosinicella rhizophila]|uniref:Dihydrolipoamide acetyltransferase component of pyruvate dehydrogenase complex n=1 Tax=Sphingosinicella rhizophila TaxID=3050082 RepID=A0ABU3Q750_9SPHN|nr:dihydrolipoamide acetyltransferase family protein [Sphingosinicella sp. GR2756]MDT9598939.1 dihydrolipoamide acetyltransferase family protein [Sphingosinicella sp. GR2756]